MTHHRIQSLPDRLRGSFSLPNRKRLHECPLEKVRFTVFGQALQELLCDHDGYWILVVK